jgi:hypothetical protein
VLLLAVDAICLLVATVVLSPGFGKLDVSANWRRLRYLALAASVLFGAILITRIFILRFS